jgi:Carboxypeptidase regulatory-like domain/TonB dependent receptor-like, beta-barrel
MTRLALLLASALVGFGASPALAQLEQGRLTGIVSDAQGAILPGVTVTATSPSLIGNQVAVTEPDGRFLFPSLPSGTYTLTFDLQGFKQVKRENIVLTLGRTFTVDMKLEVASVQESVTVTAVSPLIDSTTTAVGNEFSAEKLAAVPSATDIWAALGQSPGVRMLGFDVGGSHKSQQVGYESFGIRDQNRVVTDNVDTTEGVVGAGFYQDFFAHQEVAVSAAGGDVEMNTPGSALISTIKSGGNTFKSLLHYTYEGESFVGRNVDAANASRGDTGQPNILFYETHLDLGGPVMRDKVWFFVAYNRFKIDKIISGVPKFSTIGGEQLQTTDLGYFNNFTAKGTYRMTQKDTLIGYYQWGEKVKPYRGLSVTTPPDSILAQDSDSWMYKGQWQRVWSNRLFSDVNVGLFGFGWPMVPNVDWRTSPPRTDLGNGLNSGAGWLAGNAGGPFTFDRNKPQITASTTYILPDRAGRHDLKFGFEWLDDQSALGNNGNSGPILYRDRDGATAELELFDYNSFETFGTDWTGPDDRNKRLSIFAQDRWGVSDRLTITLGVRYDRQQPYYAASVRNPVLTDIFQPSQTEETVLLTSNKIVPRLGVSFDPAGDGRSVIKAFYGRYYYNFADRLSNLNPGGTNSQRWTFTDPNGNRVYDGRQELGTLILTTGGTSTRIDPDLKTPYADEFSVSYERQFWGESSLRGAYVRKQVRDEFATRVLARDGQYTVPLQRTVAIQGFDTGITGQQTFTLFDIPAGLSTQNIVATIPNGEGSYDYDTIQLAFNKRFRRNLFIQSSFDYQWRDELRNASNPSTSPLVADPIATTFYQNSAAYREVGNRQTSANWNYRLLGRYEFPWQIGFATNLRIQSGWPWARRISVPLPNLGTVFFFVEPIENNRSDTVAIVDLRVDKTFGFGRYRFTVMGDLFNMMNSNAVTNFNLLNGAQFNRIIAPLDPRTAMFGLRFEF